MKGDIFAYIMVLVGEGVSIVPNSPRNLMLCSENIWRWGLWLGSGVGKWVQSITFDSSLVHLTRCVLLMVSGKENGYPQTTFTLRAI